MSARSIEAVRQHLARLPHQSTLTFDELRIQYDKAERAFPLADGVEVTPLTVRGVSAEWLRPPGGNGATVLYLHGGGYVIGSPRSHRHLAAAIAGAAGTDALLLHYRLAAQHPLSAGPADAGAAYRGLLDQGIAAEHIAVAGDSAGGGLTVATLLALRDANLPRPAA